MVQRLIAAAAAFALALGPGTLAAAQEPVPLELPAFDSSKMEPVLARLFEQARRRALEALANPELEEEKQAAAVGSLGQTYQAFGLQEPAAICYQKAAELAPEEPKWSYLAARLDFDAGRYQAVRERLQPFLEIDPDWLPALVLLGDVALETGDAASAHELFRRALEKDDEAAVIHYGLGRALAALDRPEEAVVHLERALELQPGASSIHYPLARALLAAGRREEAERHLRLRGDERVSSPDPFAAEIDDLKALIAFQVVHQMATDPGDRPIERLLQFALSYLSDLDGTVEAFEQSLARPETKESPARRRAILHYVTGGIALRQGNDEAATRHLQEAVRLAPELAEPRMLLGNSLALAGDLDGAIAQFTAALEARPGDRELLLKRATAYLNAGRTAAATTDLEAVLEVAPYDLTAGIRLAQVREVAGRPEEAVEELDRLLAGELEPAERARVRRERAALELRRGRPAAAIEQLRLALEAAPTDAAARLELANLLGQTGRLEEAAAEFGRLLERYPEHRAARQGGATALVLLGRYGEAIRLLEGVPASVEGSTGLRLLLARLLAAAPDAGVRNPERALELALEISRGRESDPLVADTVALAHAARGELEEAVRWQQRAVEAGGGVAGAADRLRLYRQGEPFVASSPEQLLLQLRGD